MEETPPGTGNAQGYLDTSTEAAPGAFRKFASSLVMRLTAVAGFVRARKFRRDVRKQMALTMSKLRPDVTIGATDRRGWYTEIYLTFSEYQLRITRAIYSRHHHDLWAEIGSGRSFYRIDHVISALKELEHSNAIPILGDSLNTLSALDKVIDAIHSSLTHCLSPLRYSETRQVIQRCMRERATVLIPDEALAPAPPALQVDSSGNDHA